MSGAHYFYEISFSDALGFTTYELSTILTKLNKLEEEIGIVKSKLVPYWSLKKHAPKRTITIDLRHKDALSLLKAYFGKL